jgi:putative nucleotidyltransferase with HDIG domain
MVGSTIAQHRIERSLGRLQRRDRRLLWGYGLMSLFLVVLAEWGAFYFSMAERFGIGVIVLRASIYVLLALILWGAILQVNRQQVAKLLWREQQHFEAILFAYDDAIALKDPYTGGHGRRVAAYAATIAEAMELGATRVERIYQAGLLHDIGKLATPDRVLNKPQKLTVDEYQQIKRHPDVGAEIIEKIPQLRRLGPAVRHHHERFDGCGYPQRLAALRIPLEARVIAVADVLDAMSSDRSYRPALSWDRTLGEIQQMAGTYFDPQVVAVILNEPCRSELCRLRERELEGAA